MEITANAVQGIENPQPEVYQGHWVTCYAINDNHVVNEFSITEESRMTLLDSLQKSPCPNFVRMDSVNGSKEIIINLKSLSRIDIASYTARYIGDLQSE